MQAIRILLLCTAVFFLYAVNGQTESNDTDASAKQANTEPSDSSAKPASGPEGLTPGSQRTGPPTEDGDEPGEEPTSPHVFGWIEEVMLAPGKGWRLNAKLDTGADTSSLDARNIRRVTSKGKRYVRFDVKHPTTGKLVSLRRPFVRTTRIRRHSGKHQRRQVVLMSICLGDQQRIVEVTLTDREVFDYPLLLGRSALAGLAVVNPIENYTTEPTCWGSPEDENETGDSDQVENQSGQETKGDGDRLPDGIQPGEDKAPGDDSKSTTSSGESDTGEKSTTEHPSEQPDAVENLTNSHTLAGKLHALS